MLIKGKLKFQFNEALKLPRDLKIIFLSNFIWDLGHGLYYFILPIYIRDLGGSILDVGFFYLLMNLVYFSTMFFGGFIADRFERRKTVVLYWLTTSITPLIYSFAEKWWHLIPGAVIYNLAFFSPALNAYISTVAPKGKTARAFAFTEAGYSLGMIISPVIGSLLLSMISFRELLRVSFAFLSASTVVVSFISPQQPLKVKEKRSLSKLSYIIKNKELMSWITFSTLVTLVSSLSIPFIAPLLEDIYSFKKATVLLFGSVFSLGEFLLSILLGLVGDLKGETLALTISVLSIALGLISIGFPYFLWLGVFLIGARRSVTSLCSSTVAKLSKASLKGVTFGVYMVFIGVGGTLAPYIGGLLYNRSPQQFVGLACTSLIMLSIPLLVLAFTAKKILLPLKSS